MNVNKGRNCYNCEDFGHIARYCRKSGNWRRVEQERRLKYRDSSNNRNSNLNGEDNSIVLD